MTDDFPRVWCCGMWLVWRKDEGGDTWSTFCPNHRRLVILGEEPFPLFASQAIAPAEDIPPEMRHSRVHHLLQAYLRKLAAINDPTKRRRWMAHREKRRNGRRRRKDRTTTISKKYVRETLNIMDRVEEWLDYPGELGSLLNVRLPRLVDFEETAKLCNNGVFEEKFILKDGSYFFFLEFGWVHRRSFTPKELKALRSN